MRRARLVFACAATIASFTAALATSSAALGGCSSFDGENPPTTNDASNEADAASPPDGDLVDAPASDANAPRALMPIYARGYGSTGDAGVAVKATATGLTVDPSGGVIVAGMYSGGPIDVGNHPLAPPSGGGVDAFLV